MKKIYWGRTPVKPWFSYHINARLNIFADHLSDFQSPLIPPLRARYDFRRTSSPCFVKSAILEPMWIIRPRFPSEAATRIIYFLSSRGETLISAFAVPRYFSKRRLTSTGSDILISSLNFILIKICKHYLFRKADDASGASLKRWQILLTTYLLLQLYLLRQSFRWDFRNRLWCLCSNPNSRTICRVVSAD